MSLTAALLHKQTEIDDINNQTQKKKRKRKRGQAILTSASRFGLRPERHCKQRSRDAARSRDAFFSGRPVVSETVRQRRPCISRPPPSQPDLQFFCFSRPSLSVIAPSLEARRREKFSRSVARARDYSGRPLSLRNPDPRRRGNRRSRERTCVPLLGQAGALPERGCGGNQTPVSISAGKNNGRG